MDQKLFDTLYKVQSVIFDVETPDHVLREISIELIKWIEMYDNVVLSQKMVFTDKMNEFQELITLLRQQVKSE